MSKNPFEQIALYIGGGMIGLGVLVILAEIILRVVAN